MDLAAKHNPHQNIIDKVTSFKDLKNDFFLRKNVLASNRFVVNKKSGLNFDKRNVQNP